MVDGNPIRYQDLITPDDSIEKLIEQLQNLEETYSGMVKTVQSQAQQVANSLKTVSGATEQGRTKIKEQSEEAKRLEKAYKQLDAALAANAKEIARLNAVKREANYYNKMMVQRGKEEITTMQQIKEASYQQLSAQYALNKAYINSLTATDRKIAKNKELINSTKEIYEQMKRLQADTGKMQLNVGNYPMIGSLLGGLGGKALGFGGAAAAGMALAGVIKDNVSLATQYEKSLSVLAAILGTTKDGVQQLSEQAQRLGATTVFTAKEVAELQTELAKLGYSVDEILNMSPAVLNFAQSTGSSLADAASLAGAALRMFEKDTTHTEEFVDKMSAATTKSALSFSFLQNAMSTVSPVANAFGFQIEEVLALLGQLANAGFDASSAATATRNILLNLADANGKLAKALGEPVSDLDGLIDGLKKLNDRGIDLAESLELTDKRSVAAFNTFISGTDNVKRLRDELANCNGWAQQMANTMGDNMEGSLKSLSSAWEGLNLHINQSNGLLRHFIDWLTKAVRWVDKLGQELDEWLFGDKSGDAVFNKMADDYEKAQQKMSDADKKRAEKSKELRKYAYEHGVAYNGKMITKEEYEAEFGSKEGNKPKTGGLSAKEQKAAEKAAKQRLQEHEKEERELLALKRSFDDAWLETIEDANSREYAKETMNYQRKIEDAQRQLDKLGATEIEKRKILSGTILKLQEAQAVKQAQLAEKFANKEKADKEKKLKDQQQQAEQSMRMRERAIQLEYEVDMENIDQIEASEKKKTKMRLEAEKKRLEELLKLYRTDGKKLKDEEVKLIEAQIQGIKKALEMNEKDNKDLYDLLGFNLTDKQKDAIDTTLQYALDSVNQFMDAYTQAADAKRQLADAEVDRAQNVLEKEIEARANGYANEVDIARKELQEAKKNQRKAIEEQKKAQRAKELIDTATQASSLITATANIWSSFTSLGPFGVAAAIAATALMWTSFAAAKIKAFQVSGTGSTEEYGEGTVELLQGGSHQSGNDIDLGTKKDGTRRRAEGGEFFAVINKRSSRRYRGVIPDVVRSLNNGTFAEKYMNAYNGGDMTVYEEKSPDISGLSRDVRLIREQGEREQYLDGDGNTVVKYKNLKRVIRR